MDFSCITPCGGNCVDCTHFRNKDCKGCRENGGRCVTMWENGCDIYSCCEKHDAHFCGICTEFPCKWLVGKIVEWDIDGIERLVNLAAVYNKEKQDGQA